MQLPNCTSQSKIWLSTHNCMQASESDKKPEELSYAKMDCTEGGVATCKRFGVEGFPTLKYLSKG